jgi:hypothetical protein
MKKSNDAMNPDFENQLQRQHIRQMPSDWRVEILGTAKASATTSVCTKTSTHGSQSFLAALLWPCPQAWAGLAAVWVALGLFNHFTSDPSQVIAKNAIPFSPAVMMAFKEQERLLASLVDPLDQPAEPPKNVLPKPRSENLPRILMG